MMEDDFPLLRQLAASSAIGSLARGTSRAVQSARETSWIVRQLESATVRVRTYAAVQRWQTALAVVGVGAITHFALTWPAPAYARSALPVPMPLAVAAIAFAAALVTRSTSRS